MTWETSAEGTVSIGGEVPELSGQALAILTDRVVGPWMKDARNQSADTGVPVAWILAIIYAESQGNERVVSPDGGYGLMQLTSSAARAGLSNDELLDGSRNIEAGTAFIARIRDGYDLPRLAGAYNAGSPRPSTSNRWGLVSSPGYIDRVVAANNTIISLGLAELEPPSGVGDRLIRIGCTILAAIGLGFVAYKAVRR